jgi:hypothetical protein
MAQTPEILREVVKEKRKFLRSFNKHFSGKSSASPESLSLELDGLWDEFEAAYDRYDNCLDALDEATAKKFNRDKFMSGKSLAGYWDEAKLEYEEAVGKINLMIHEKKDRARKRVERAIDVSNGAIKNIVSYIGESKLEDPNDVITEGEAGIEDMKMKLRRLHKLVADQLDNLEKAEETEGVSENLLDETRDLVDKYQNQAGGLETRLESLSILGQSQAPDQQHHFTASTPKHSTINPSAPPFQPAVRQLDMSQYGVNGSMVGPIHSHLHTTAPVTHQYNPTPPLHSHPGNPQAMKMRYTEWPVFSGLWPDWPRFYSRWRNVCETQGFSGKNLAEQLLTCVKGEAYNRIKAVVIEDDSSYTVMWDRLLRLYTDPASLLSWVYMQFDDFKPVHAGNPQEIVTFANDVEKIYSDLYQIDSSYPSKIISNKVDDLAKLLPSSLTERWLRRYVKFERGAKESPFAQFVTFCCEERDVYDRYLPLFPKSAGKSNKFSAFQDGEGAKSSDSSSSSKHSDRQGGKPGGGSSPVCWMTPGHQGHWTWQCKDFQALSDGERRKKVISSKKCVLCLNSWHKGHKCSLPPYLVDKIRCRKSGCTSKVKHRKDISCNAISGGLIPVNSDSDSKEATVGSMFSGASMFVAIYRVQVPCRNQHLNVFCDNGSNLSLICEKTARRFNFRQVCKKKLRIRTINGVKEQDSFLFEVPVVTKSGIVTIPCYSTPNYISDSIPKLDIRSLNSTFPKYKDVEDLQRPDGPVEVLLGVDCFGLHPERTIAKAGNLSILRGPLGDTVVGAQESTEIGNQFSIELNNFHICKEACMEVERFIAGDEVGVRVYGACKSCSTCPRCVLLSHQEQQELQLVRQNLSFDETVPRWMTALPFASHKENLPDNYGSAMASLVCTERTLSKDPAWRQVYHQNIQDYVSKGYARKVSKEEARSHAGLPRWFLPHLAVLNPGSVTTPVRTVFDSARRFQGVSLNDILVKGPRTQINRSLDVALRWREYSEVMIGDIKAMFHHIGVVQEDQWFQSFLFREDPSMTAEWYVMQVLIMGHVCSPCIATEAVYSTGERVEETKPEVCYVLKESSYVDDLIHSCKSGALSLAREVHKVLKDHGFTVKMWQFRGEASGRSEEDLYRDSGVMTSPNLLKGGHKLKVLGIGWSPVKDTITFEAELNFTSKKRGVRTGPDVTLENLSDGLPNILTKRMVLEQVMRCYDPLGFLGPHILVAKLLLRKTWELGLGWDDSIPPDLVRDWVSWFKVCFQLSDLTFPRCTRPVSVLDESPWLVILSDGSQKAYGFVAYVRWQIGEEVYHSYFMLAKNRIAPVNSVCIPRMELNGALLGARGREIILGCCRYNFSRIIHLVDSETVLCQVSSLATRFKVYESGRIGEIQTVCGGTMQDWFWLPTEHNISDWNTRGKSPQELKAGSMWQDGPDFLKMPLDRWPVKSVKEIRTQVEVRSDFIDSLVEEVTSFSVQVGRFKYTNTSRWEILVRGLALVIGCIRSKKFVRVDLTPGLFRETEMIILKDVQISLLPDLDTAHPEMASRSRFRVLSPVLTSDGVWCVGGRVREKDFSNLPVLLPSGHPVAVMLMQRAHKRARHAGVHSSLCKFREQYYITNGAKLAKRVRGRCTLCRLIDQVTVSQKMGKIPLFLLKEAPVFTYVQLDIFGPWCVRGEVQKRTTGKCWGVLFVCLNSRAVHIEFIAGYSTDSFLLGFERFRSIRGWPAKVYSDPGTQLVAADKELRTMWKSMDMDKVSDTLAPHGTEWVFSPADSPHRQGVVESLIGSVKRSIKVLYGHGLRLSWQEYVTLGHQVADLINSRPLGVLGEVGDSLEILTPNNLILGRNSSDNPGNWSDISSCPRLSTVNKIVNSFWTRWMQVVRPAMVLERKWNADVRNLCTGDVVLVLEKDAISKSYKLARVTEAVPDEDGKVRSVKLVYKSYRTGTTTYTGSSAVEVRRCVQRLCLIVPVDEVRTHNNDY